MFIKERNIYVVTSLLSFIICNLLKCFSKILNIYFKFLFILTAFIVIYVSILLIDKEYFINLEISKIKILLTKEK